MDNDATSSGRTALVEGNPPHAEASKPFTELEKPELKQIEPVADANTMNTRLYRIGDVARHVGVSTHALRAWERRYGTVEPLRTPGGSRRYDVAQVERLKTLKDLTDYGHSIGEVARLPSDELKRLLAATLDLGPGK